MLHTDSLQLVSKTEMYPCEEKLGFLLWCLEMGYLKETSCCLVSRELRCFEYYCQLPCEQRVTVFWVWLSAIHVRVNKMYCVCIYFCWGSFDSHETLWVYVMINVWLFIGLSFKFGVSKYLTFLEHHQCGKPQVLHDCNALYLLCSVQFSLRWYVCARKSPYALHSVSAKFPQCRLWNGSNVRLIDDGPNSKHWFTTSFLQPLP